LLFFAEAYRAIYYYHGDHLGSSNYITDRTGRVFEHTIYLPYGETWIDEGHETSLLGYKFTGKELDEETGLYYFGARYYDPQFSNWISTDPGLVQYLPDGKDVYFPEQRFDAKSLKGSGGVYNSLNINLYHYANCNPVRMTDPDGKSAADNAVAFSKGLVIGFGGGVAGALLASAFVGLIATGSTAGIAVGGAGLGAMAVLAAVGTYDMISAAVGGKLSEADKWELAGILLGGLAGGETGGAISKAISTRFGSGISEALSPTIDQATGKEVGRFIADSKGNVMIEPKGGKTVAAGRGGGDTHTTYPNGSNYQRLNPNGHANNPKAHGHGHLEGTGPGMKGQGPSIDPQGNIVPSNSKQAHWDIH